MAVYNKFDIFTENVAEKVHNLGTDTLTVALTNVAPVATNTVIANITQISYTGLSSRNLTVSSSSQTSGTYKLVINDLNIAATGTIPTFRYVVIYNSTAAGGPLIAWFDAGSSINMVNGDTLMLDFDATNGLLQIV
jgi:hypothetical protein